MQQSVRVSRSVHLGIVAVGVAIAASAGGGAGCSSTTTAPATAASSAPALAGVYTTTDSGKFTDITFFDATTYALHRTGCGDADDCFEHGTYAIDDAGDMLTLTSSDNKTSTIPISVSAASTTPMSEAIFAAGVSPLDDGLVANPSGGLVAASGPIVQKASIGGQSFSAGSPNGGSDTSACPLSSLGTSIESALQAKHANWKNITWGVSCSNLPGLVDWPSITPRTTSSGSDANFKPPQTCTGGAGCEPDFKRHICTQQSDCTTGTCAALQSTVTAPGGTPKMMCLGDDDYNFDNIYKVVANAKDHVNISALYFYEGGYAAALRNALTYLNATAPSDHVIKVRIIGGNPGSAEYTVGPFVVKNALNSLTRDIKSASKIEVTTGTWFTLSWNHSKIVTADGNTIFEGGNAWGETAYNLGSPVHDVTALFTGDLAKVADHYSDYLWSYIKSSGSSATLKSTLSVSGGSTDAGAASSGDDDGGGSGDDDGGAGNGSTGTLLSSMAVIGVGTSGGLAGDADGYKDSSGDEALYALIKGAKSTVRIAQQDLGSPFGTVATGELLAPGLKAAVATALKNGVDVYVVLSGAVWQNGWTIVQSASVLADAAKAMGVSADTICSKLHMGFTRDATGALVGHHAKIVIADDAAFYIGSQNLYPGGTAGTIVPQLAEFGFIVDNQTATQSFTNSYWAPLWQNAKGLAISGSEASSCYFAAAATKPTECSTGWSTCSSGTCSFNGQSSGYCCKNLKSASGLSCVNDSDGICNAVSAGGICALTSSKKHTCTMPDAIPCE